MTSKTSLSAASGKNQNILAPVSLVCGLLAWTLLPILAALAAILTGHIAYAKDKRLNVGGQGMALAGLILGYSGLATAMMLIGIWIGISEEKSLRSQEAASAVQAKPAAPQPRSSENQAAAVPAKNVKPLPPVIPPAAVPILSAQQRVEEALNTGTPLDEINETHEEAGEDDPSLRYWQRIEIKQGNIVITPKPDIYGLSAQIMLFSTRENGGLSWTCVGELDKTVEETVCR
ncbi:DUF4190 domain-containing protein [Neisseria elongata]|uniref:DUF4190 domain-containing protein n=1 Tax=Neisseria elongata TaxID=495 RepID=UPI000D3C6E82|nr:DUF4190 domain-containing protein [Neisseria elongata]